MNDLIVKNADVILQQRALIEPKLIKNQAPRDLFGFLYKEISDACVYRGMNNKTEKEIKIIAYVLQTEISNRFPFLTLLDIHNALECNKYGMEYGYTVCPATLIKCIEETNFVLTQENNKYILNAETQKREKQTLSLTKEEKLEKIKEGFVHFRTYHSVDDVGGIIWNCVHSFEIKRYKPTLKDIEELLKKALGCTYRHYSITRTSFYSNTTAVRKDKVFRRTKAFKGIRNVYFREMWLREFYNHTKWAEELNKNKK